MMLDIYQTGQVQRYPISPSEIQEIPAERCNRPEAQTPGRCTGEPARDALNRADDTPPSVAREKGCGNPLAEGSRPSLWNTERS